jgi:hypothetical protein
MRVCQSFAIAQSVDLKRSSAKVSSGHVLSALAKALRGQNAECMALLNWCKNSSLKLEMSLKMHNN